MMKSYYITVIYILLIDNIFAAQLFDLWSDYDPEEGELGRIQICKLSQVVDHIMFFTGISDLDYKELVSL